MFSLKKQLIRLGETNPDLRDHLRPILDMVCFQQKTSYGPKEEHEVKTNSGRRRVAMKIPKFRDKYLDTFFREKDLRERRYDVEAPDGTPHSIPTGVVLEHIAQTRGRERDQIKDIIRKIDFRNGDLHHFFEHLAKAIAANY